MMPLSLILGYLVLSVVLATGGLLCFRRSRHMWRTAIQADLPYCERCAPPSAVPAPSGNGKRQRHCIFCGHGISATEPAHLGRAPRRPNAGFAYSFACFVLISSNIAFTLWWFPRVIWHRFVPLGALLVEQRTPIAFVSHMASDELTRRILDDSRGLPSHVIQSLVEKAMTRQAELDRSWDDRLGQIVDAAWYKGLLTDAQIQKWVENMMLSNGAAVEAASGILGDGGIEISLRFLRRGTTVFPFDPDCALERVILNGKPLPGLWVSGSSKAMERYEFRYDVDATDSIRPTNHLEYVCRFDYAVPGEIDADQRSWRKRFAFDFTWEPDPIQVMPDSFRELPLEESDR